MTSVSSTSRYELVPPPAPNTVARPTTLGACQVRLQLSMLFVPMTTRVNFWVMKFTSLVALEQLNSPNAFGLPAARTASKPLAARSSASSHVAGRSAPFARTIGCVSRVSVFRISDHLLSKLEKRPENRLRYVHDAIPGAMRQWRTGHFDGTGASPRLRYNAGETCEDGSGP